MWSVYFINFLWIFTSFHNYYIFPSLFKFGLKLPSLIQSLLHFLVVSSLNLSFFPVFYVIYGLRGPSPDLKFLWRFSIILWIIHIISHRTIYSLCTFEIQILNILPLALDIFTGISPTKLVMFTSEMIGWWFLMTKPNGRSPQ